MHTSTIYIVSILNKYGAYLKQDTAATTKSDKFKQKMYSRENKQEREKRKKKKRKKNE